MDRFGKTAKDKWIYQNRVFFFKFLVVLWNWVHLARRPIFGLLYQPRMMDDDECGVVGGMRIGRGKPKYSEKSCPVPLCPPQIPHDLTWDRSRAAAVGNQRLTAWAMARPNFTLLCKGPCTRSSLIPNLKTEDVIMCCVVRIVAPLRGRW
jgi:hypothetical protein